MEATKFGVWVADIDKRVQSSIIKGVNSKAPTSCMVTVVAILYPYLKLAKTTS